MGRVDGRIGTEEDRETLELYIGQHADKNDHKWHLWHTANARATLIGSSCAFSPLLLTNLQRPFIHFMLIKHAPYTRGVRQELKGSIGWSPITKTRDKR